MMKSRDTCILPPLGGPAIIISVENGIYHVLTWEGHPFYTDENTLRPFPTVPGATDATVRVPDYSVAGVAEIVELSVDLDAELPVRIKSPLYPLFSSLEANDREKG